MQKFFTPLFFLLIYINTPVNSFAQVNVSDSMALVNLYNSTNGSAWTNKTGWLSGPVSSWHGIGISGNNVISIALSNNNLTGALPASLGNLSLLSYLDLSFNHLTGAIPYALGNTNLNTLYLNNNQLSGPIPGTLGNLAILGDLELNNNNLSGNIPDSLQTLFSLYTLELSSNQLNGSIPAYLGTLPSLNFLNLYNNQLTGSIPSSLTTSSSIVTLNLSTNQLSGNIPSTLGNASAITGINLSHNTLTGSIPSALGKFGLYLMDISYNQLTGIIPISFTNITSDLWPTSTAINNNKLTFDGLENIVQAPDFNAGLLSDAAQGIIALHLNSGTLSMYAGGTLANDTFHWYKNGVLNTTIVGDSTFTPTSGGNYSVIVTNNIVSHITGLQLLSDTLSAGVILPVSFLNFTGVLKKHTSQLQWQTGAETNTAYYNIQRSTDDISFTTIGTVDAAGNSSGIQNYDYADNLSFLAEQPKNLFYRLQEIDNDGQSTFSNIVNIPLGSDGSPISIYPNPVSTNLNIDLNNNTSPVLINITDANGIKYVEQVQTGNHIRINTSNFTAGVYFIQVTVNGALLQQKFIKQ